MKQPTTRASDTDATTFIIKDIIAREILDSRGNPTVEVDVTLADGSFGRAAVPSGASTGSHEALELRDGDKKRYGGKGVQKAIENIITKIKPKVKNKPYTQQSLDEAMMALDGTPGKSLLGANAILGVSLAFAHAVSDSLGVPLFQYFNSLYPKKIKLSLPMPMMNIMNGGAHANKSTDIQEFMIIPVSATSFPEAIRMGSEVFQTLKGILKKKGFATTTGDEGGFAPTLPANSDALELITEAVTAAGYKMKKDIAIALDVASTEFYADGIYTLACEGKTLTSKELIDMYASWAKKYPIVSIEDGLAEDDWSGYELMTKKMGEKTQIVGDDLFVTNPIRLQKGIDTGVANSILVKINQIGTITETIQTVYMAHSAGYTAVMSHRSGETEDVSIAHLAVGLGCGQIKTGSLSRTDRVCKYNELIRIAEFLGKKAALANPFIK
jgi:enolase